MLSFILLADHEIDSPEVVVEFVCLLLIRSLFLPWYLFHQSDTKSIPRNFSLVGTTLWEQSLLLLVVAVGFMTGLAIGQADSRETMQIGTATTSLLVGMLMVANQRQPTAQLVGLVTFEGGVTLVEMLSPHAMPFPVLLGMTAIDLFFVLTLGQYLVRFAEISPPNTGTEREGI